MKYTHKLFTMLADAWKSGDFTWGFGTREAAVRANAINDVHHHIRREGISFVEVILYKRWNNETSRREVIGRALTKERAIEIAMERYEAGIKESRVTDEYTNGKDTFEWEEQVNETRSLSKWIEFETRDIDCTGIETCLDGVVAENLARQEREKAEKAGK